MGIVGIRWASQLLLGACGLALAAPAAAQTAPPQPPPAQPPPPAAAPPAAPPPAAAPPAAAPPAAAPPAAPGTAAPAAPAGPPPPVGGYPSGGPPAPPPPPPPGYYYGPPPPPPPPPPDENEVHTHDGFYLRLGLGGAWGQVTSEFEGTEFTQSGGGWLMDILLGGTISNMIVIGGGFHINEINNPEFEGSDVSDADIEGDTLSLVALGPFVDVFFGPNSGGHVGSMIGVANIGVNGDDSSELSEGWGWSLFGGYDFWVSDNWGLGLNARYMYVTGEREFQLFNDEFSSLTITDTAHTFGILFTGLYN